MDKIVRFFECLVPCSVCNIKCEYCYVVQQNRRKNSIAKFNYSAEHIAKALTKKRLGGTCYFSICAIGETLVQKEVIDIVHALLKNGHYVNVTTNGTLSKRFDELLDIDEKYIKHLQVAFSFHYLELQKINKVDEFFLNVKKVKAKGGSFLVQLNMYDGYMPYLEEIKELCLKNLNALPQIAVTRKQIVDKKGKVSFQLHTNNSKENYVNKSNEFNSPLFKFTMDNFNKKRKQFCYAGEWSMILNLATGVAQKCYFDSNGVNIFENIEKPIKFKPIGCNCRENYCVNSSHFLTLGVIPSIETPTYVELRDRKEGNWYNKEMHSFLSTKLKESHKQYGFVKRIMITYSYRFNRIVKYINKKVHKHEQ